MSCTKAQPTDVWQSSSLLLSHLLSPHMSFRLPATEAVLALLRNPEYAVYGATKVRKENGLDSGEDAFNEVSLQERGKFKEETLVNVGGRSRSKRLSRCVSWRSMALH